MSDEAKVSDTCDITFPKMGKHSIPVKLDLIPIEQYSDAVYVGLLEKLKAGLDKIKTMGLEGAELEAAHEAARKVVEENVKKLFANELKTKLGSGKGKSTKLPAQVRQVAERLAIDALKDEIRRGGDKPSHYRPADLRKWAKELIASNPQFVADAEEEIRKRTETPKAITISLAGLKPDPAKVEADKAKKSNGKKGNPLSAKQAGMPAPRAKPSQATAH